VVLTQPDSIQLVPPLLWGQQRIKSRSSWGRRRDVRGNAKHDDPFVTTSRTNSRATTFRVGT
jgi:hypothetical protein